jgi:ABC-type transport system, involved in lipoprotein release, permease component
MKISDLFIMGLKSLTRRKARTVLTVLGVVIGSLSIIIMVSIGKGMNNNFNTQLMQQGSLTMINVNSNANIFDKDGNWTGNKSQALTDNLVQQIKAIEHVKAVSPIVQINPSLYAGKYQCGLTITGIDRNALKDFEFPELQYGSYPSEQDATPIVFGYSQPWGFFNPSSRSGQQVQIDMRKQKVILKFEQYQVDKKKKEFKLVIRNTAKMVETKSRFDYNVYMDMGYLKKIYREYCNTLKLADRKRALTAIQAYSSIQLNVDNVKNVEAVQDEIKKLGFTSESDMQFLLPLQNASKTMQMVLGALGAVAMVVSAVSIANTMIMSIYERTKEIGIMKVLGCTIKDIRKLFLFEAGMIGLFGGMIGIGLGYIASWGVNKFGAPLFQSLLSGNYMYDMKNTTFSIIPIYLPFASLAISICVGLVSGYFPARRATKISAIEAMKTEG